MKLYAHDYYIFYFHDSATTEIYTLSLHDALPILRPRHRFSRRWSWIWTRRPAFNPPSPSWSGEVGRSISSCLMRGWSQRSEEHTSELQSRQYLVCRLLLEKKKRENRVLMTYLVYI